MSCGVGCRLGSDPALLWLWCRLAAVAPIRPLAWELPCTAGAALKKATPAPKNICVWLYVFMARRRDRKRQNKNKSIRIFLTYDQLENLLLLRQVFHRHLSEFSNSWKFQKGKDSSKLPKKLGITDMSVNLLATASNCL